jgi:hypothetical protein
VDFPLFLEKNFVKNAKETMFVILKEKFLKRQEKENSRNTGSTFLTRIFTFIKIRTMKNIRACTVWLEYILKTS